MDDEKQASVSVFSYEGVVDALMLSNKRMLTALIVTCATLVLVTAILIFGNAVNNRVWMNYANTIRTETGASADAGIHQQSNPGNSQ